MTTLALHLPQDVNFWVRDSPMCPFESDKGLQKYTNTMNANKGKNQELRERFSFKRD